MEQKPRVKLPPFDQIGIVVRDIDQAIKFYSTVFGWGPFQIIEPEMKGFTYRGRLGDCRLKIAMAQSGSIEIELIQVLEGETPHSDFLREKGVGLQHLRFQVDDLKSTLAEMAKEGITPVFQHSLPQLDFAYIHSESMGSVQFELIEFRNSPTG